MRPTANALYRLLPNINRLLDDNDVGAYLNDLPRRTVVDALRGATDGARRRLELTNSPDEPVLTVGAEALFTEIKAGALRRLKTLTDNKLKRVINATGIVLHTNLGRAPLSAQAADRLAETAVGYCNLEYDLSNGTRRGRNQYIETLITGLTGAEAALAVNNNAAAVYLALNTICAGREAVISRGETVEIGDSFRILEIIEHSGCVVRETGAVNITKISDYEQLINPCTGVLLKVHRSNFYMDGFTGDTPVSALAGLKEKYPCMDFIVMEDMGSGLFAAEGERAASDALNDGADLVSFSGDKLLGGPQAGILAGKAALIERMKRSPLYRCLRIDKLTLAALEETLRLYVRGEHSGLPVTRMLTEPAEEIKKRAERLAGLLNGIKGLNITVEPHTAAPGGGSKPGGVLESFAVYIETDGVTALAAGLREQRTPVIAAVKHGRLLLDMRTVRGDELPLISEAFHNIFGL